MTIAVRVPRPVLAQRLILPVVLSGTFVQLLSVTVMQVAVPDVQRDLGAGPGTGQLVLAGYTLTFACSLITSARLGDRHGYRSLFVLGMAVFTLAAVIAAAAPVAELLVGARLLQGLGSGLMAPQILSIIQTALPQARRARALGAYGATMALASLAGPLLGGVLLQADPLGLGWRAAMLLPVPVGLIALTLAPALPAGSGRSGRAVRVDAVGAGLSLAGFALLVLPLTVGRDAGWPLWTWLSLAVAAVLLGAFAAVQRRVAHPLIHPAALAGSATRWGIGLVFVFNAGVPSFTLLLSLHAQGALGHDPLWTAMVITPYAAAALVGSVLAERLGRRFGATALTASAAAFAAVSLLVAATIGAPGLGWALVLVLAVGGLGFGVFTASAFAQILARVRPEAASSLSGLLPTAQQLGGTVGVALAGVVYYAPAPDTGIALWHAMTYEAVVFVAAAGIAAVLARARPAGPPDVGR